MRGRFASAVAPRNKVAKSGNMARLALLLLLVLLYAGRATGWFWDWGPTDDEDKVAVAGEDYGAEDACFADSDGCTQDAASSVDAFKFKHANDVLKTPAQLSAARDEAKARAKESKHKGIDQASSVPCSVLFCHCAASVPTVSARCSDG